MAIKPTGDRILIKVLEVDDITKGGIILPDSAKKKSQEGEVIEVGPGKRLEGEPLVTPVGVNVGDTVLFGQYTGSEVTVKDTGKEYLIIREDDVLAVIG